MIMLVNYQGRITEFEEKLSKIKWLQLQESPIPGEHAGEAASHT